jgi:hypothetical protein
MTPNICVLIDFENIERGTRQVGYGRFDPGLVLNHLRKRGNVRVARAYADFTRYPDHTRDLLREGVASMQLSSSERGKLKNGADIALAVDGVTMAHNSPFLDTFVVLSADVDFVPLLFRLRELGKAVWFCGVEEITSTLLLTCADEFIPYGALFRASGRKKGPPQDEEFRHPRRGGPRSGGHRRREEFYESSPEESSDWFEEQREEGAWDEEVPPPVEQPEEPRPSRRGGRGAGRGRGGVKAVLPPEAPTSPPEEPEIPAPEPVALPVSEPEQSAAPADFSEATGIRMIVRAVEHLHQDRPVKFHEVWDHLLKEEPGISSIPGGFQRFTEWAHAAVSANLLQQSRNRKIGSGLLPIPAPEPEPAAPPSSPSVSAGALSEENMALAMEELRILGGDGKPVHASQLSQAIAKRIENFKPKMWGYRTFSGILVELENRGRVRVSSHPKSQSPMVALVE